MTGNWDEGDLT